MMDFQLGKLKQNHLKQTHDFYLAFGTLPFDCLETMPFNS